MENLKMLLFLFIYAYWYFMEILKKYNPLRLLSVNAEANKSNWVRPLGLFENHLETCHKNGILLTSYCLTLNSAKALKEEMSLKRYIIYKGKK